MCVLVPPQRWRLRFWLLGLRLPVEYRPWVATQVTTPGYVRRRLRAMLGVQLVCYVIPQVGLAIAAHSRIRLAIPLVVLAAFAITAARSRALTPVMLHRVLAYHGVTAEGALVQPVSAWAHNPLGRVGLALLTAQVLLFSSGVAVAGDRLAARHDCRPVPAATLSAIAEVVGVPRPGGASFRRIPGLPQDPLIAGIVAGSPLLHARQVATPFDGIHEVSAYVRTESGRLVGPAVWTVIDPHTTFALPTPQVSAQESTARVLTPSLGFSFGGRPDPSIRKAKDCARDAR